MTGVSPLTERTARTCVAAIIGQFKHHVGDGVAPPTLVAPTGDRPHWSITWEDGPYEWAMRAFMGGTDEELCRLAKDADHPDPAKIAKDPGATCPTGVLAEPINTYTLGLYPA